MFRAYNEKHGIIDEAIEREVLKVCVSLFLLIGADYDLTALQTVAERLPAPYGDCDILLRDPRRSVYEQLYPAVEYDTSVCSRLHSTGRCMRHCGV